MKNLLACLAILAAFNSSAQVDGFQLPYNPDVEPDGYIGVGDVLNLLAMFGQQWNASDIYLSNDNSSMTMYVGDMKYHNCVAACSQLDGNWRISSFQDFAPILDSLGLIQSQSIWLNDLSTEKGESETKYLLWQTGAGGYPQVLGTSSFSPVMGCYCSTHERPKVEYSICTGTNPDIFGECTTAKVAEGWYPLPNRVWDIGGTTAIYSFSQAFWRWAD